MPTTGTTTEGLPITLHEPVVLNTAALPTDDTYDDGGYAAQVIRLNDTTLIWAAVSAGNDIHFKVITVHPVTGVMTVGEPNVFWNDSTDWPAGHPLDPALILRGGEYGDGIYDMAKILRISDTQFVRVGDPGELEGYAEGASTTNVYADWYTVSGTTVTRDAITTKVGSAPLGAPYIQDQDPVLVDANTVVTNADYMANPVYMWGPVTLTRGGEIGTPVPNGSGVDGGFLAYAGGYLCSFEAPGYPTTDQLTMYRRSSPTGAVNASMGLTGAYGYTAGNYRDAYACTIGSQVALIHSTMEDPLAQDWGPLAISFIDPAAMTQTSPLVLSETAGVAGALGGLFESSYRGNIRSVTPTADGTAALVTWVDQATAGVPMCAIVHPTQGVLDRYTLTSAPALVMTGSFDWARFDRIQGVALSSRFHAVHINGPSFPQSGEMFASRLYLVDLGALESITGDLEGLGRWFKR